jgi:NAD(P)-dependent dehydrogenase (short-subunit alcohol dehydrogenase family)
VPDRVALVAGASGGIGGACAAMLERGGWMVVGVDRDDGIDVTMPGGAEAAVARATERFGRVDAIVHAVGMSGRSLGDGPVTTCADDAWHEVLRVNLESVFRLLRCGVPALASSGGGAFVVVGSVLAHAVDEDFLTAAYTSAKGGLESLVRAAALEGAPHDVRVNVVAAGLVDTPMAARGLGDAHLAARLGALQPLGGRALTPEEVAGPVVWLCSAGAAAVTGVTVPVDRGWMLR